MRYYEIENTGDKLVLDFRTPKWILPACFIIIIVVFSLPILSILLGKEVPLWVWMFCIISIIFFSVMFRSHLKKRPIVVDYNDETIKIDKTTFRFEELKDIKIINHAEYLKKKYKDYNFPHASVSAKNRELVYYTILVFPKKVVRVSMGYQQSAEREKLRFEEYFKDCENLGKEQSVNEDIIKYVEENIIPQYENFDKGHNFDHVQKVIENSLEIAKEFDVNIDMVYVIAAYHDLGLIENRENHHNVSAKIIREDEKLKEWFSDEEIEIMAVAASEHRASNPTRPTTDYGLIISEGDRDIDYNTYLKRTLQFGFKNYPEYTKEEHIDRVYNHLVEKYGYDGYLNLWIETKLNKRKLEEIRKILVDEDRVKSDLEALYIEEIKESM